MINDFFIILRWWVLVSGLGVVFLPLTFRLFPKFFDKGYAFSKIIALLCVSYVVWLLGSLKVLQFVPEAVWLVVLAGVALNLKGLKGLKGVKEIWKIIVFEEILFFVCLAGWSFIRGFQPNIIGLEKFMDFGFVNSILRSKFFPPQDMWFAGETINYYYFGHLMTAVLTKLSGLDSAVTYNLMISTIFALTFTATFSLAGNLFSEQLRKRFRTTQNNSATQHIRTSENQTYRGTDAPSCSEFSENAPRILSTGLLSAFLLTLSGNLHTLWWFLKHRVFTGYWYPDATRFIVELFGAADNTIHEFPLYSWVVADLHGHMLNIPTVLLILALLLHFKPKISQFSMLALCFATTFMTNIWDIPIYFLVTGLVILGKNGIKGLKGIKRTAVVLCSLFFVSCLLSLPFHLNFQNIAQGVALVDFRSPPWMLLVLWGFPLLLTVGYLAFRKSVAIKEGRTKCCGYITVLLAVGGLLILIPEIIYVKDIYINSYQRANTMFKLTYQSFIMFSLAGGYIIVKTLSNLKKNFSHFAYAVSLFVLLIFVFIYPFYATKSYYGLKNYQGLEGLKWLEQQYPDDFEAINWLKENVKGQPVILEAVGESYTDFARVSSNTGLPTVVGWTVHEWLWRGSYDGPGERAEDVRKIYESADAEEAEDLLTKYKIEYIFVGELERKKYTGLLEERFGKMGKTVFENDETKIYQL